LEGTVLAKPEFLIGEINPSTTSSRFASHQKDFCLIQNKSASKEFSFPFLLDVRFSAACFPVSAIRRSNFHVPDSLKKIFGARGE